MATMTSLSRWDGCGDKGLRLGCHHNESLPDMAVRNEPDQCGGEYLRWRT